MNQNITQKFAEVINRLTHPEDRRNSPVLAEMQSLGYWTEIGKPVTEYPIPDGFGCYTKKGDNALKKKAQTFLNKLAKAKVSSDIFAACRYWVRAWEAMDEVPAYREDGVGDTEVRCQVFYFMEKALTHIGYGSSADHIWDKIRGN